LEELTPGGLHRLAEEGKNAVILFHTPFCGTCRLAERMLDIVAAMCSGLPFYKVNINFVPDRAREWRLESVPCVLLLSGGQPVHKQYRMGSVDDLYRLVRRFNGEEAP
jgi:thioredoxin-like negative regulator of GroEL